MVEQRIRPFPLVGLQLRLNPWLNRPGGRLSFRLNIRLNARSNVRFTFYPGLRYIYWLVGRLGQQLRGWPRGWPGGRLGDRLGGWPVGWPAFTPGRFFRSLGRLELALIQPKWTLNIGRQFAQVEPQVSRPAKRSGDDPLQHFQNFGLLQAAFVESTAGRQYQVECIVKQHGRPRLPQQRMHLNAALAHLAHDRVPGRSQLIAQDASLGLFLDLGLGLDRALRALSQGRCLAHRLGLCLSYRLGHSPGRRFSRWLRLCLHLRLCLRLWLSSGSGLSPCLKLHLWPWLYLSLGLGFGLGFSLNLRLSLVLAYTQSLTRALALLLNQLRRLPERGYGRHRRPECRTLTLPLLAAAAPNFRSNHSYRS
jgi:hypothetical protein